MKKLRPGYLGVAPVVLAAVFLALPGYAQEQGDDGLSAALPVSINAWVDSRIGTQDYYWDSDNVQNEYLSDVYVRYAGLEIGARPNDHVEMRIVFLFQELFAEPEEDDFDMDEGWIKLNFDGLFVKAGKMFPAFIYEGTWAIEDPFTWYVGDCRKTAIEIGYDHQFLAMTAAFFNGDVDTVDDKGNPDDERIDDYVLHLHLNPLVNSVDYEFELGACYLSDMAETEMDFANEFFINPEYESAVPGLSGYLIFISPLAGQYRVGVHAEYIESGRFSRKNYVDLEGNKTRISLTNVETAIFADRWRLGAQYSLMQGFDWLRANQRDPELTPVWFQRYGGFAGLALNDYASVAAQAMVGRDNEGNGIIETYFQFLLEF